MDKDNLADLRAMKSRLTKKNPAVESEMAKVILFGDYGGLKGEEVIDPYYGAKDGFSIAYEQMTRFSKGFITQVLLKQS